MQKTKVKVYFLGSGAFAVPFLDALSRSEKIDLTGVGTQPDKPSGRKRIPKATPLGAFADAMGIACMRVPSVSSEEFMRNLPKAIDALPPKYAQVIKMRNEQDLSYEEIASALNISVGTVKSRLSRAREYLRDELCKIV